MPEPMQFTMPSLGADMEAGTLVEWLVKPGDTVARGQLVATVETQKGAIDIEIWHDGTVRELCVAVDEKVPVGTVLATFDAVASASPSPSVPTPSDPAPAPPEALPEVRPAPAAVAQPAAPVSPSSAATAPTPSGRSDWIRSSPSSRRRASELGVDLRTVRGTGLHGALTRADVERASVERANVERANVERANVERSAAVPPPPTTAAPPPAAPPPAADRSATARLAMRQAIANAMERSNRDIPAYYLQHHVDVRAALDHVARLNRERPIEERILPMALFLRAIAKALAEHRELNGTWVDGGFRPATGIHPGVAIALRGGGLVIPALHDADQKDVGAIMADLKDLTNRARAARLRSSELADGTITVTGLGDQGVETVFGVVYPPQVALVGLGRVLERPWAVDGMLTVRPVLSLTLAADHRATDGHVGSLFLSHVSRLLAAPESL